MMAQPDFLNFPLMRQWLEGVEPAWTLLTMDSLRALGQEPMTARSAIRIASDLGAEEVAGSAVARNILVLLRQTIEHGGLKLTATGHLTRAVVAEMRELIEWPDYDQAEQFSLSKVINEFDFLPLNFVHVLARAAKLVRPRRGKLLVTPLGRSLLGDGRHGSLQAILFHLAFWHLDLSYFDRMPGTWPQPDIGIALWSLSVCAGEWQTDDKLARLCTLPEPAVLARYGNWPTHATEARILRPLLWFGLLEFRSEDIPGEPFASRSYYRKTALFDRLLAFDVDVTVDEHPRH
ncbi:hypothetical protein SAMN05444161_4103 [Rhizobiales bacterium GAS191]|jgi:hypothetical protein|nr:hypothetical protein SAMN05444161_4103 [Rhizobiales bacterium GAS191]